MHDGVKVVRNVIRGAGGLIDKSEVVNEIWENKNADFPSQTAINDDLHITVMFSNMIRSLDYAQFSTYFCFV